MENSEKYMAIVRTIKNLPLWFLIAIFAFWIVILFFPHSVPESLRELRVAGAIMFGFLVVGKFVEKYRSNKKLQRTFSLSPNEKNCYISSCKQQNGKVITQVNASFLVKNLTTESIYLAKAQLDQPKFGNSSSEVLIRHKHKKEYGSSFNSAYFIPPKGTLPVQISIYIEGLLKCKSEKIKAQISVYDTQGNKQTAYLKLNNNDDYLRSGK